MIRLRPHTLSDRSTSDRPTISGAWRMYLLSGMVVVILMGLVIYGYIMGERLQRINSPLLTAVREIDLEMNTVWLWIDEIASGRMRYDTDAVWKYVDQSVWYFTALLNEKKPTENKDTTAAKVMIRDQLNALTAQLNGLKLDVAKALEALPSADQLEETRGRIRENVQTFLAGVSLIEKEVLRILASDRRSVHVAHLLLFSSCLSIAMVMLTTIRRYERRQASAYAKLETVNQKLTEEVKERTKSQTQLRQSEEKFRSLFEAATDYIHILDTNGNITLTNPATLSSWRYDQQEIVGKPLADFMAQSSKSPFEERFKSIFEKGTSRNEHQVVCKDGTIRTVDCSAAAIRNDAMDIVSIVSFQKDITERKQTENKLLASHQLLHIANRHTAMLPLLREFLATIKVLTHCQAAAIRVIDTDGRIPYAATDGLSRDFCELEGNLSLYHDKGMCSRVIQRPPENGCHLYTRHGSYFRNSRKEVDTLSQECRNHMRKTCIDFGYESLALIPIRTGDSIVGLIHVADQAPYKISQEVLEILEHASDQLGAAIQRVRVEEALHVSHQQLEARVRERTEDLSRTNLRLNQEIEEHQRSEKALIEYQNRLRTLSAELLQTEERERRRIAIDIHDRIGQTLAITKIKLGLLKSTPDPQAHGQILDEIAGLVSQIIRDTRSLTFEISPPVLYELGLKSALEWLGDQFEKEHRIKVRVDFSGPEDQMEHHLKILLFRTVRELFHNTLKHANASTVEVRAEITQDHISLSVTDDGAGFHALPAVMGKEPAIAGFGLFSIQEQLHYYGGQMKIESGPGRQTRIEVYLPMAPALNESQRSAP